MCLILGPRGVGKSLLMEKLTREEITPSKQKSSESVSIKPGIKRFIAKSGLNLIEPENCSFSSWKKHLESKCTAILFVIDSTNRRQISEAVILLLKVLAFPAAKHVSILILLNKCDLNESMSRAEVEAYFHLKDVISCTMQGRKDDAHYFSTGDQSPRSSEDCPLDSKDHGLTNRRVYVLECSALDNTGLPFIVSWLQQS